MERERARVWDTRDELHFIDQLGQHVMSTHCVVGTDEVTRKAIVVSRDRTKTGPEIHLALLKNYLRGAKLRHRWGPIDRQAVIEHVEARVAMLLDPPPPGGDRQYG